MAKEFIPNFIRKNVQYKAHEILTAKEFNALLNLIITQGDYNSSWLEYLQNDGIPNAIADLSADQIEKALTAAVEAELSALASSVVNKTSATLNNPMFSFIDLSTQADMSEFRTIMEQADLKGSFCVATNLVGTSSVYPALLTLQAMRIAGHELLTVGTDSASLDGLTSDEVTATVRTAKTYMQNNLDDSNVFVYPNGSTSDDTRKGISKLYDYAINVLTSDVVLDSDMLYEGYTKFNIPVLYVSAINTFNSIKPVIDAVIANNFYCIIAVDTSKTEYNESELISTIEYIKTKGGIKYVSISEGLNECANTINNKFKTFGSMRINNIDENGNESEDLYIHW